MNFQIFAGKVQRRFAVHPFIDEEAEYVPHCNCQLSLLYTVTKKEHERVKL